MKLQQTTHLLCPWVALLNRVEIGLAIWNLPPASQTAYVLWEGGPLAVGRPEILELQELHQDSRLFAEIQLESAPLPVSVSVGLTQLGGLAQGITQCYRQGLPQGHSQLQAQLGWRTCSPSALFRSLQKAAVEQAADIRRVGSRRGNCRRAEWFITAMERYLEHCLTWIWSLERCKERTDPTKLSSDPHMYKSMHTHTRDNTFFKRLNKEKKNQYPITLGHRCYQQSPGLQLNDLRQELETVRFYFGKLTLANYSREGHEQKARQIQKSHKNFAQVKRPLLEVIYSANNHQEGRHSSEELPANHAGASGKQLS